MSYEYLDAGRIKVYDFIEYYEDGVLVASIPATFDFSQVEDRYRDQVASLTTRRIKQFGISTAQLLAWQKFGKEDDKWHALQFFKRIFTPRPKMPGLNRTKSGKV